MDMAKVEYIVRAGNNTKAGENCKYEASFSTIEEALKARAEVDDNPWRRIVVREGDFEYDIEPRRIRVKVAGGDYEPCNARGTPISDI
jgi:hypothetical protein